MAHMSSSFVISVQTPLTKSKKKYQNETVFEYVNSIIGSKKNMMRGTENDELAEKLYDPFVTNRSLSYYRDAILFVNELNIYNGIDHKLQYEFLLHALRSMPRNYGKWPKPEREDDLRLVMKYYQLNLRKAQAALSILTEEQLTAIRAEQETGGFG